MNREIIELREVVMKLVPMLTGKGLTVTQRGSEAFVEAHPVTRKPTRINIPNIPDTADASFISAIQGFIDHEVGHVLITNWDWVAGYKLKPSQMQDKKVQRLRGYHNIVEDTMIEREMGKIFPGSQRNIANLRRHFIERITKPAVAAAKAEREKFAYLLVVVMRALAGHVEFKEYMDETKQWDNPLVKELVDKLPAAVKRDLPKLKTTEETLAVAKILDNIFHPPIEPPRITGIDPNEGLVTGMTTVTIQGANFVDLHHVRFDTNNAQILAHTKTEITVMLPPHAAGVVDVSVKTDHGSTTAPASFTYIVPPPPPPSPPTPSDDDGDDEEPEDQDGQSQDKPEKEADEGDGDGERDHKPSDDEPDEDAEPEDAEGEDEGDGAPADSDEDAEGEPEEGDAETESDTDGDAEGEPSEEDDGEQSENDAEGDQEAESDEQQGDDAHADEADSEPSDDTDDEGAADDQDSDQDGGADDEGPEDGAGGDADDESEGDDETDAGAATDSESQKNDGDGAPEGSGDRIAVQFDDHEAGEAGEADEESEGGGGGVGNGLSKSLFDFKDDEFAQADLSSQVAILIANEAVDLLKHNDYNVFTREFDRIEPIEVPAEMSNDWVKLIDDETKAMTGKMSKDIERMMASQSHVIRVPGFRSGRLHAPSLYRVMSGDDRLFNRRQEHRSKDTAVTLLIDNSGSMAGSKAHTAMVAGYALASTLERVNIASEVLGFTTGDFSHAKKGASKEINAEVNRAYSKGLTYHRLTPIMMPIYKEFDERINSTVKRRIAYMAHAQVGMASNVDGESLEYAAIRLMRRREQRKVMLVLSDGQPSGAANAAGHLKQTVRKLEAMGIDLVGIGIKDAAVRRFYTNHIVLNNVADLPTEVMRELKAILA